jgi:alcohol dehydrogenase class IV
MGVTTAMIPSLAAHCMADACHATNPKPPTQDEYERLFEEGIGG